MAVEARAQAPPAGPGIAVVERAIHVLQAIAAAEAPVGLRELGRRTSLSPPTTLRLVRTLEGLGLIERLPDGSIRSGVGVNTLIPAAAPGVPVAVLEGLLRRMVEVFGEGATAGIDDGDGTLFVAHVAAAGAVQVADVTGDRWPMHATASGLVLMTGWSDERLSTYLAEPLQQLTPKTPTDPSHVRERVAQTREQGYAWSVEEATLETCGVAVPVTDRSGTIAAAVGLYGPLYRLSPADDDVGPALSALIGELDPFRATESSGQTR